MSRRLGRSATQKISRIGLVLSPQRARRGLLAWAAVAALFLAIGALASHFYSSRLPTDTRLLDAALEDNKVVQQRIEQLTMTLSVAQARGVELERQIDALNQRLRETQEELAFFRKTRDGRR